MEDSTRPEQVVSTIELSATTSATTASAVEVKDDSQELSTNPEGDQRVEVEEGEMMMDVSSCLLCIVALWCGIVITENNFKLC